ncbi:hypothetical protein EV424DRAFT_1350562 [Suillus variegatus]|nr:hypothetical protein EV424DRAFT_1350562 [Suillus variegatus]
MPGCLWRLGDLAGLNNPSSGADYSVQSKQVDAFRDETYGDWEGMVHPSGVMYYFTWKTKTYTGTDIKRYSRDRLHNLNNWIHAARRRLQEDAWFLVVEPIAKQDGDHYEYYCVDTRQHVIAWFDAFDASLLFQECVFAHSNRAESHLSSNDFMTEQGVAFCGRIWSILQNIHVDSIINSLDTRQFIDRFNDDNVKHSTLIYVIVEAGVIMAVDVSLLDTSVKR